MTRLDRRTIVLGTTFGLIGLILIAVSALVFGPGSGTLHPKVNPAAQQTQPLVLVVPTTQPTPSAPSPTPNAPQTVTITQPALVTTQIVEGVVTTRTAPGAVTTRVATQIQTATQTALVHDTTTATATATVLQPVPVPGPTTTITVVEAPIIVTVTQTQTVTAAPVPVPAP